MPIPPCPSVPVIVYGPIVFIVLNGRWAASAVRGCGGTRPTRLLLLTPILSVLYAQEPRRARHDSVTTLLGFQHLSVEVDLDRTVEIQFELSSAEVRHPIIVHVIPFRYSPEEGQELQRWHR